MGIGIVGIDILRVDILGIDILALPPERTDVGCHRKNGISPCTYMYGPSLNAF